jgi:flagellar basal-body rod modification protein FlgD
MQSIQQMVRQSHQAANPGLGVASSLTKPRAAVGSATASTAPSTGSSTAASTGASTITANDFLTLLVAEMKNQDPTTPTDPAQYISQMVDVNSLQQLIGINQGISSLDTAAGATSGATGSATGAVTAANTAAAAASGTGVDAMLAGTAGVGAAGAGTNGAGTSGTGTGGTADSGNGTPTWLSAVSGK